MNFWVSTILTISEGWKGCGRGQTFSQKFVFLSFKQICMHFEFQPLLTISKGVGRGFKLLVVWPSLEVNIQPPATFPHLVVGVLHQTFTHFGGCGKGVGSGGSNVCFSYFLLIEKKNERILSSNHLNHFWGVERVGVTWAQLFTNSREGGKGGGSNVWYFFSYFCWLKKIKGIWVQATFDNFKRGGKGVHFFSKMRFLFSNVSNKFEGILSFKNI